MIRNLVRAVEQVVNAANFRMNHVQVGRGVQTRGLVFVRNRGVLTIGDEVRLNSRMSTNPIGGDTRLILFVYPGATLEIGSRSGISNSAIVCRTSVKIESDVFIGGSTKIYDNDFHPLEFEARVGRRDDAIRSRPVWIRAGAFVGAHVIILKGVTIGERAVIGAGSVVTRDVPAEEVWAGNPARFVRRLGGA